MVAVKLPGSELDTREVELEPGMIVVVKLAESVTMMEPVWFKRDVVVTSMLEVPIVSLLDETVARTFVLESPIVSVRPVTVVVSFGIEPNHGTVALAFGFIPMVGLILIVEDSITLSVFDEAVVDTNDRDDEETSVTNPPSGLVIAILAEGQVTGTVRSLLAVEIIVCQIESNVVV